MDLKVHDAVLRRAGQIVPFRTGNIFRRLDTDLSAGLLKHQEPDWRETLRLSEELSQEHTEGIGSAAVDLWQVSAAVVLRADTFWTFDIDHTSWPRPWAASATFPIYRSEILPL